jgi:hypothetical protein
LYISFRFATPDRDSPSVKINVKPIEVIVRQMLRRV